MEEVDSPDGESFAKSSTTHFCGSLDHPIVRLHRDGSVVSCLFLTADILAQGLARILYCFLRGDLSVRVWTRFLNFSLNDIRIDYSIESFD